MLEFDVATYSYGCKDALEHFNDDMNDWMAVMDAKVKASDPEASWTVTTAPESDWDNYYIDTANGHNISLSIKDNCYRPSMESGDDHKERWAGIDCSGFFQRCAQVNHDSIPALGSRIIWTDDWNSSNPKISAQINVDMIVNGYGGRQYSDLIEDGNDYNRIVPGDIITIIIPNDIDHIAIVNYVTGERGIRNESNIYLIQAKGGDDTFKNRGRITDDWTWGEMGDGYQARRLKP